MSYNMASMIISVFVTANSENQVWYKEVIKALSDILSQTLSAVGDITTHHLIHNFTENTKRKRNQEQHKEGSGSYHITRLYDTKIV